MRMKKEIRQITLQAITPDPAQPRKEFGDGELQELAQSIRQNGLLSPITVKANGSPGQYIIIAGERRYRAHQVLGKETIECIVYTGNKAKELQLIENINRKDLNPVEVANAYQGYLETHTIEELAEVVGKPKNIISWILNLVHCHEQLRHLVAHGQISMLVAISASKLTENGQLRVLRTLQANKLSVGESQKLCEHIFAGENQKEMFAGEPKLTEHEIKVRAKVENAITRACQALQEINKMELDNPGITAQAIAEKLDITQEKVDLLHKLVGKFKSSLQRQRVRALC